MFRLKISITLGILTIPIVGYAALSGSLDEKQIQIRLQPEAEVNITQSHDQPLTTVAETKAGDVGKHRYEETCHICHGPGLAGAPKLGDKSDWAPRIAEGIDAVVQKAIKGYKAMPPKGTCMTCSDEEIRKAVEYMINQSK